MFVKIISLLLIFSFAGGAIAATEQQAHNVKRVLVVDSYASSDLWTERLNQGIHEILNEKKLFINYDSYQLGVRYQPGIKPSPADIKALQFKLDHTHYDLVIANNNPAANLFLNGSLKVQTGTPVLASSYQGQLAPKIPAGSNMTGLEVPMNLIKNIDFGQNILGKKQKIVIITDASEDGLSKTELEYQGASREHFPDIILIQGSRYTTPEMLEEISRLPENSLLLFHSWSSSREDQPENAYTVLPLLKKRFKGLILGKYLSYIDYGSAGGIVVSGLKHGRQAGKMAFRLLRGEAASSIPVQSGVDFPVLSYPSLIEADISMNNIPVEVDVINMPDDFLVRYRAAVIYIMISMAFLLILYVANYLYRKRSQQQVQLMFHHLPLRIFVVDQNENILYAHVPDNADTEILMPQGKIAGLPEAIRTTFSAAVKKVFETRETLEFDYKSGEQQWHVTFIPLPHANPFRTNAVMWISGNITELHNAHQAAAQVAERFRMTLESIGDGVIATDSEERITLMNPVAAHLTGYTPQEAVGKKLDEVFHIVSYRSGERIDSPLKKALASGDIVELANHTDLIAKDGTRRHIADSAAPIKGAGHDIDGGVLVFRDVTDEYQKRDLLQINNVILSNASKIANFIYFRRSDSGVSNVSVETPDSFWPLRNGAPVPAEEWISPEDLPEFNRAWKQLKNDEIPILDVIYSAGPTEQKRYFEMRVERNLNEKTGKRDFFGVIQDITHVRRNELLYRDNLNLLENIINNLPGFIFVKDVGNQFRYIMCNSQFEDLCGKTRDRIIGRTDPEVFDSDMDAVRRFQKDEHRLLETGGVLDTQEVFINSGNQERIVRDIRNIITQSDGRRLLIGMGLDISHQHQLELAQQQTIETLNNYINSERIINQSLTQITLETDFDRAISKMLEIIGENVGADRSYMFRYTNTALTRSDNEYEWVRKGIQPQIHNLQNVDMSNMPTWTRMLSSHQDIIIPDISNPPAGLEVEAVFLKKQNIRSLLVSGIWVNGTLYGYVGLDFVKNTKKFSDCDLHTVHSIVNLFLLLLERRRQFDRIADSVSLQRQIVDNISIPLMILDLDYHIVIANPSTARECSVPMDQIVGMKCYEAVCGVSTPPEDCPICLTLQDFNPHTQEMDIHGKKMIVNSQPLFNRENQPVYILVSMIDITDLVHQKEKLQKAMELAQAADRAKSFFLATVSHELRTPLNAVIGFSELLQNSSIRREEQQDYLKSINFAGTALLNLINDVLDLSRLEADQLNMVLARIDLAALIMETAAVFKLKALEKKLELKVDCGGIRTMLYLDNLRLRQVILNLLGNAIKFTEQGTISLYAAFEPVSGDTGTLTIRVSDTGIGITPENAQKIFEPFIQEGNTRGNKVYEGSGLGLAITQRLIKKMGGSIHLESTPGKGSVFTVILENVTSDSSPLKTECRQPAKAHRSAGNPAMRVLLVDDVAINLRVLAAMLKKMNIQSVQASSGEEALQILEKDTGFQMILTDLWMPGINGTKLAQMISENPQTAKIPVVAITADTQILVESPEYFSDILLKPVTLEALEKMIRTFFPEQPEKSVNP